MNGLIDRLRNKVREDAIAPPASGDLFELIAAACSQCCTDSNGGNKVCPPPRLLSE